MEEILWWQSCIEMSCVWLVGLIFIDCSTYVFVYEGRK